MTDSSAFVQIAASPGAPFGFSQPLSAVVLGARGGIGEAVVRLLNERLPTSRVLGTSRDAAWARDGRPDAPRHHLDVADEKSWAGLVARLKEEEFTPQLVFNATGFLQDAELGPERSSREITLASLQRNFQVNAFGPALMVRSLLPLLPRKGRSVMASLSARVGSIGDNRKGGWYSYRASKAAQNMLVRCAALEAARTRPQLCCVLLHPGTVKSELSAPFTAGDRGKKLPYRLLEPAESAAHLSDVVSRLDGDDTGSFWAWDGEPVPW